MGRKGFILVAAAVILLAAAVFTYISLSGKNTSVGKDQVLEQGESTAAVDGAAAGGTVEAAGTAEPEQLPAAAESTEPEIIRSEDIEVRYGSPEYDLKALLCEDSDKRTFVKLEYYLEGEGTTLEADSQKLPELAGIFERREEAGAASGAFKVRYAYLNPVFSKVYIRIAGGSKNGFEETALYSLNLKDFSVKKLFNYTGKYTDMSFNRDYSLLGYSFGDPPYLSVYQENELFEILDCKTDEFKVRGSRTASGKIAGMDRDPAFVYNYTFEAWQSNTVARLKQTVFSKKDPDGQPSGPDEVLYDTVKDKFMNMDGSPAASPAAAAPKNGGSPAEKAGDEAAKVLADFYSFLPSEKDYQKAMNLLDDGFRLQLELLQQFGAVEITKGDISSEGASMYSEILKAAKLDSVVKVESADGIYTVYYYQTLSLNADSQVRQALSAQIRKEKEAYKIVLIKDADGEKPPFAQQAAS
jgi:hypothetical protein